jgi:hypothetical protein
LIQAIHYDVVRARQRCARIAFDFVDVLEPRRRKWMMAGEEAAALLVPFEEREVDDPEEIPALGGNQSLLFSEFEAQRSEDIPHARRLSGHDQREIVLVCMQRVAE